MTMREISLMLFAGRSGK